MEVLVELYSTDNLEIKKFLSKFLNKEINLDDNLTWKYSYKNPVQATDIIGVFIDNKENFNINMWISLDKRFFFFFF